MTENRRTPGADVVDISFPIDVPDVGAVSPIHKEWFATETSEGADGGIDPTGNATTGPLEELRRKVGHCLTFNVQGSTFNV
jgi:hypothetical protein